MVDVTMVGAPAALGVQANLGALPFRRGSLAGAWAHLSDQHLRRRLLPMTLADLHGALGVNAPLDITLVEGTTEGPLPGDDFPGRLFALWGPEDLRQAVLGAGFAVEAIDLAVDLDRRHLRASLRRMRTLPDVVGPGMRLLVCGLNPSLYAADAGVNFARPGNRFWPAAMAAGLLSSSGDPAHALRNHKVGFTDLVKRATSRAEVLTAEDYRRGLARVEWLVGWLRPQVLCVVGLAGWRAAVDRRAVPGRQRTSFPATRVYLMPNTSGLNAHTRPHEFVEHLRAAAALAT